MTYPQDPYGPTPQGPGGYGPPPQGPYGGPPPQGPYGPPPQGPYGPGPQGGYGYGPPPQGPGGYGPPPQPWNQSGAPGPGGGRAKVLALGAVGLVVVLAVGVGAYFLLDRGPGSAREAADTVMQAVQDRDIDAARAVTCDTQEDRLESQTQGAFDDSTELRLDSFEYTFVDDQEVADREHEVSYDATLGVTTEGQSTTFEATYVLTVADLDGAWQVCGLDVAAQP